jgi:MFS family permease
MVHERLLLQALVPEGLLGRVFGIRDAVQCWAFAPGFICAGVLAGLLGPRALFLLGGAGALLVWGAAGYALRHTWRGRRHGSALPLARQLLAES